MPNWQVDIVSPNGTKSNLSIEGDTADQVLSDFITDAITVLRDNDAAPIEGDAGTAPLTQSRKQAVSDKNG